MYRYAMYPKIVNAFQIVFMNRTLWEIFFNAQNIEIFQTFMNLFTRFRLGLTYFRKIQMTLNI